MLHDIPQAQKERDEAVSKLRKLIVGGGLQPGDRLPPERELIVQLEMSRTLLRKALDALEHEGAIWRHVGKGTFVAARGAQSDAKGLAQLAQQVTPVQLMRSRLALEPALAREAAIHASAEAVMRINVAREKAVEAPTWDSYEAQDDAFHRAVAEATDNVLLLTLFDHLNEVRRAVAWASVVRDTERPPRDHSSFAEHTAIADAIARHMPAEAHEAMRRHLGSVSARLFED